jgi:two-component system cell cycle sensor histidine kinase/response regulator CckA
MKSPELRDYQALFDNVQYLTSIVSTKGRIEFASKQWENVLGYIPNSVVGMDFESLVHAEDVPRARAAFEKMSQSQQPTADFQARMLHASGSWRWTANDLAAVLGKHGVEHFIALTRDITDRMETENRLLLFGHVVSSVREHICVTDLEGKILYVNPSLLETLGYQADELIGEAVGILHSPRNPEGYTALVHEATLQGTWSGEVINVAKDGREFTFELTTSVVRNERGEPVAAVGVSRDVTQQKQIEQQLLQAQKLESIGTLAGGVAHDFNNLLTGVIGYADLLMNSLPSGSREHGHARQIKKSAERAAELTRQLLAFGRKPGVEKHTFSLAKIVTEVQKLLERTLPKNIEVRFERGRSAGRVQGDPTQIEQAIMNICINARDAMPNGGVLTLELDEQYLDATKCATMPPLQPGPHIRLAVRDTGFGMTEDVRQRIFEPFFTTKGVGEGSGLGMTMVYGIIQTHKGSITVDSAPRQGTAITIYLPAAPAEAAPPTPRAERVGGPQTILVAEDEEIPREFMTEILQMEGYNVLAAANGLEALELYKQNADLVSLVITDIVMPKMGGDALVGELLLLNPNQKILVVTGYAAGDTADKIRAAGVRHFIQKPFTSQVLLHHVRETLGAKAKRS